MAVTPAIASSDATRPCRSRFIRGDYPAQENGAKWPLLPFPPISRSSPKPWRWNSFAPRQPQPAVRRMRRIVDIEGISTAVARRNALDLKRQHVRDADRALQ